MEGKGREEKWQREKAESHLHDTKCLAMPSTALPKLSMADRKREREHVSEQLRRMGSSVSYAGRKDFFPGSLGIVQSY